MTVTITLGVELRGRGENNCKPIKDVWEHYDFVEYSRSADLNEWSRSE